MPNMLVLMSAEELLQFLSFKGKNELLLIMLPIMRPVFGEVLLGILCVHSLLVHILLVTSIPKFSATYT
jgi:hypothetical protein